MLLLELEPPFDKRDVQLARRRMAKHWHPDIAPPGRQLEHERHLKAINEAADQLERLAEDSRGGKVSRNAVKVSAAAARKARAEEGRRAYEEEQRARAHAADREKHDPFASRVPDHSVVHRYARCLSYPEWGVGIGQRHLLHRRRRRHPAVGARVLPGRRAHGARPARCSSSTSPSPTRAPTASQRFMTAAKHALAEGDFALAAQRLVYARDAEPRNAGGAAPDDDRVLAGGRPRRAAGRAVRDWARVEPERPAPYRTAARIYEDQGALSHGDRRRARETERSPGDARRVRAPRPPAPAHVRPRGRARRATSGRARSSRASRGCSTSRWSPT